MSDVPQELMDPETAPVLPQELCDEIIDMTRGRTLRACALVCRAFVLRSQKQLFSHVDIVILHPTLKRRGSPIGVDRSERLQTLLSQSPHIIRYIHSLRIANDTERPDCFPGLAEGTLVSILAVLSNLRSFAIEKIPWSHLGELRGAISDLCKTPNLHTLKLVAVGSMRMPALAKLASSPHLKHLYLRDFQLGKRKEPDFKAADANTRWSTFSLHGLQNQTVLDTWLDRTPLLSSLLNLSVECNLDSTKRPRALIDRSRLSLESLHLHVDHPTPWPGTYAPVPSAPHYIHIDRSLDLSLEDLPSLRRLSLSFNFDPADDRDTFVPWLSAVLRSHGEPSTLHKVILYIHLSERNLTHKIPEGPQWESLTQLLTQERFPVLRTFEVVLERNPKSDKLAAVTQKFISTTKRDLPRLQAAGMLNIKCRAPKFVVF
ncbi:hypothetical protein DFH09DRAFT_1281552 [Mycena vulgaris]|nr:hypothetical protein DFH09DRAFT_1281552 [Mycena vulgaris]